MKECNYSKCGKEFLSHKHNKIFCSPACAKKSAIEKKTGIMRQATKDLKKAKYKKPITPEDYGDWLDYST